MTHNKKMHTIERRMKLARNSHCSEYITKSEPLFEAFLVLQNYAICRITFVMHNLHASCPNNQQELSSSNQTIGRCQNPPNKQPQHQRFHAKKMPPKIAKGNDKDRNKPGGAASTTALLPFPLQLARCYSTARRLRFSVSPEQTPRPVACIHVSRAQQCARVRQRTARS